MTALVKVGNGPFGAGSRRTLLESFVACGLLAAAIVLGGASGAGFVANAAIQMAATLIAATLLVTARKAKRARSEQAPLLLWMAFAALVALQLCPLPPELCQTLPGRAFERQGFAALGIAQPWEPLSLAPDATLRFGVALIPPLAMLLMVRAFRRPVARAVIAMLIVLMAVSVVIGVFQSESSSSPFFFYSNTNLDSAVGFFANANHFGTMMAATIPLAAGLIARWRQDAEGRIASARALSFAVFGATAVTASVGVLLSGSFAALLLDVVAILSGVLIVVPLGTPRLRTLALAALIVAVGAVMLAGALLPNGLDHGTAAAKNAVDDFSRLSMWSTTSKAIGHFGVTGSGMGTLPKVFPMFENADHVGATFANHAHNDLLELLLDGGIPAMLLLVVFLGWFGTRLFAIWGARRRDPIAQGAAVVVAMVLLHSLVDYPLRTAAVAVLFAFCVGLVARPARAVADEEDVGPVATRHLVA